ncbi:MAG: CRISPR-associated endonuclease Cas1, partial [Methanothermobacter tenebrarum]
MLRPLYVFAREKVKIMADGPSLWIEKQSQAGQRVPLKYISRVYLFGKVEITGEALIKLAENNISLTIMRVSGAGKAILLPFNRRLPKYHRMQRVILDSYRNLFRYLEWLKTYRSYFQLMTVRRFLKGFNNTWEIGEGDYKVYLMKLLSVDNKFINPVKKINFSLISGLIAEEVTKAKLDPHVGGYYRRTNFAFLLDLAYLMEAVLDELVILFFKQERWRNFLNGQEIENLNDEGVKNIIHRFENKKEELRDKVNKVIDDFFMLM